MKKKYNYVAVVSVNFHENPRMNSFFFGRVPNPGYQFPIELSETEGKQPGTTGSNFSNRELIKRLEASRRTNWNPNGHGERKLFVQSRKQKDINRRLGRFAEVTCRGEG